jgi:hypothetical protein
MVDGSISHVPWDVCIRGSNLLERHELEDSSIDGVQLHDDWHGITLTQQHKIVVVVNLASRYGRDGITHIVEEFTPLPVTIEINSVGESMVIGCRCIILRGGITGNNDELVDWVEDCATNFLILRTSRRDWEELVLALIMEIFPSVCSEIRNFLSFHEHTR